MTLSTPEIERYSRHLSLAEVGLAGQERLARASALVIGAGGLGTPALTYLAAAGVGRIGLIDFDTVSRSNLHRQVLFTEEDVGLRKTDVASDRLSGINPHVTIHTHDAVLSPENAREIISMYDVVIDGSDTFATKYLVSDAAVLENVPHVYASVLRFQGETGVFQAGGSPCYRCLYPEPPSPEEAPSCAEAGVLGVVPSTIGSIQTVEAIKLLLGIGQPLVGRLLRFDALAGEMRTTNVPGDPECPICGLHPTQHDVLTDYEAFCSPTPPDMSPKPEITVTELKRRMENGENPFILDVRRQDEYDIANLDGHLIPLDELPRRLSEIEEHKNDETLVVHCRTGGRSERAVEILREQGFSGAVNLIGGTHAWSDEVDPSMPKY